MTQLLAHSHTLCQEAVITKLETDVDTERRRQLVRSLTRSHYADVQVNSVVIMQLLRIHCARITKFHYAA